MKADHPNTPLENDASLPLGKDVSYPRDYNPALLFPIARAQGRAQLGALAQEATLPFIGWDLWRGYELSWLKPSGLPATAILKVWVPCDSPCIVESKSFKLYLNSLNHSVFADTAALLGCLERDLNHAIGAKARIALVLPTEFEQEPIEELLTGCLDEQSLSITEYQPNADLLNDCTGPNVKTEHVFSRLLKSNCPVTGQPDWATLHIGYHGHTIDHAALLKYIVSFRDHQGFHEQCVERIFCDIMDRCQPQSLSVYARYTRRGGMDINPWRATVGTEPPNLLRSAQQ